MRDGHYQPSAHRIARDLPLFLRSRTVWGCCGVCGAAPVAAFRHAGRVGAGKLLRFGGLLAHGRRVRVACGGVVRGERESVECGVLMACLILAARPPHSALIRPPPRSRGGVVRGERESVECGVRMACLLLAARPPHSALVRPPPRSLRRSVARASSRVFPTARSMRTMIWARGGFLSSPVASGASLTTLPARY